MNKFYTVTVFEGDETVSLLDILPKTLNKKTKYSAYHSQRVMGVFNKRINATNMVKYNRSDIHECLYNYCLIEEFKFGFVYGNVSKVISLWQWNQSSSSNGHWKQVNIPVAWGNIFNFAIG